MKTTEEKLHEFLSEIVSDTDDSVAGCYMRCTPNLREYVQGLEARIKKLEDAASYALTTMDGDVLDAVTADYAADHNIYEAIELLRKALNET